MQAITRVLVLGYSKSYGITARQRGGGGWKSRYRKEPDEDKEDGEAVTGLLQLFFLRRNKKIKIQLLFITCYVNFLTIPVRSKKEKL